ncbi:5795_t:CDS:2, partial [Dentiscutata heterogama]
DILIGMFNNDMFDTFVIKLEQLVINLDCSQEIEMELIGHNNLNDNDLSQLVATISNPVSVYSKG